MDSNLEPYFDDELDYESEYVQQNTYQNNLIKNKINSNVVVNSLEQDALKVKPGVRLLNSFVGGVDVEIDNDDDDDCNANTNTSKKNKFVVRSNIHERITAHRRISAERFGINLSNATCSKRAISLNDINSLYESLDVDPNDDDIRLNAIFVTGVEKLSEFEIKRIFAENRPDSVQLVDESSCTVRWREKLDVVQMFLDMTKKLRRVREPKKAEEGELVDSNDEEEAGQVKEENGEDVAVVIKDSNEDKNILQDDFIEVNVEKKKIPRGKWRIISKHVPDDRLLFVRYATGFDIRRGVINLSKRSRITFPDEELRHKVDKDGYEYAWKSGKNCIRPGLNVFDEKGYELEWDYEHDTRFFENNDGESDSLPRKKLRFEVKEKNINEPSISSEIVLGDIPIRSRGRGSKKFLAAFACLDDENVNKEKTTINKSKELTLASDDVESVKKNNKITYSKEKNGMNSDLSDYEEDYDDEVDEICLDPNYDLKPDLDPTPTPQPWN